MTTLPYFVFIYVKKTIYLLKITILKNGIKNTQHRNQFEIKLQFNKFSTLKFKVYAFASFY